MSSDNLATWDFDRTDLPTTIHGLMSLWGGFDEPSNVTDSGCEKRLEFDLMESDQKSVLAIEKDQWNAIFASIDDHIDKVTKVSHFECLLTEHCLCIVSESKVVITASAKTLLHKLINPMIALFKSVNSKVEWCSFMRKNVASPWESDNEINHVMACEYADLKHAFPHGKSFLIGPVDGDHYFFFVHDAIDRRSKDRKVVEDDVQINLVMYNVHTAADYCHKKITQHCHQVPSEKGDEYEMIRFFDACGQPCVTFETNSTNPNASYRVAEMLKEYKPDRCTLITLFDPQTESARRFAKGDRCGFDKFDGFQVENRCTNEFAPGYIVRKTMFTRSL